MQTEIDLRIRGPRTIPVSLRCLGHLSESRLVPKFHGCHVTCHPRRAPLQPTEALANSGFSVTGFSRPTSSLIAGKLLELVFPNIFPKCFKFWEFRHRERQTCCWWAPRLLRSGGVLVEVFFFENCRVTTLLCISAWRLQLLCCAVAWFFSHTTSLALRLTRSTDHKNGN